MQDLDDQIRVSLERLTGSAGNGGRVSMGQLATRRRNRMVHRVALGTVPAVVVVALAIAGLSFAARDNAVNVTAGESEVSLDPREAVTVVKTEVTGSAGGTTRVVIEFDRPLPGSVASYVDDITSVDDPVDVAYTTQDSQRAHVCDGVHNFGASAVGTVDVFVPSGWFADGNETYTSPLDRIGEPPKFVVCGPHRGFYQYSIWGPASADAGDVAVSFNTDRTQLIVQVTTPARTTSDPTNDDPVDASTIPTVDDLEQACRDHLTEVQGRIATPGPSGSQVKVFEPRFENGPRTVVLFDDESFFSCVVRSPNLDVSESGGGPVNPTSTLADDEVQMVSQTWSGGEPGGSCTGQPCGPGSGRFFGRVGSGVSTISVVLADGSAVDGLIEPDGWFTASVDIPSDVPLFQQRIQWTLDDGTQLSANPADLATPEQPHGCSRTAGAIQTGDLETLTSFGIPARLDTDLVAGELDLLMCGSDNMTGEFVLVIGRTSGQMFVLRNTTKPLLVTDDDRANEALSLIEDRTGALLTVNGKVVTLTSPPPEQQSVPIAAVFEDATDR